MGVPPSLAVQSSQNLGQPPAEGIWLGPTIFQCNHAETGPGERVSWSPWRLDQHPRGLPVHPFSHLKQEQGQGLASATSLKARGHLSQSHGVPGGETEAWGRGASRELAAELVGAELGACQAEAPLLSPLETWPLLEPEVAFLSRLPGHLWSPMATSPSPQPRKSQSSGLELKRALDSEAGRGETSEAAAWGPGGLRILSWTSSQAGLTLVIKQRWQEIPGFIFPDSSSGWWGSPLGGPAWVPGGPRVTPRARQPLPWPLPPSPCPLSTGNQAGISHIPHSGYHGKQLISISKHPGTSPPPHKTGDYLLQSLLFSF